MQEYYQLSILRKTTNGSSWEEIYLKINGEKSRVIEDLPNSEQTMPLNFKLEKISNKELIEALRLSDFGH